jgi:hypothetical protein
MILNPWKHWHAMESTQFFARIYHRGEEKPRMARMRTNEEICLDYSCSFVPFVAVLSAERIIVE